ncbi:AAA family ATPase [uncultured Tenacibaculum sp.]|uniref:ATP-dependent nuclease n=1 Tax=uncultured Tenacibaculum sp. TaxID=174713 RepID=UPI002605A583|nr:AAA family ATPase [uncultured Tenacibaculum sp.]
MFLEKLNIKNFRGIKELNLNFNSSVNIIIGENNAGKSAIIDALRICLSIGKQWKDIGIKNDEDFHINVNEINSPLEPIEFGLVFKIETPQDREYFQSLLWQNPDDPTDVNLQIQARYSLETNPKGNLVLRWDIWGGQNPGQRIKPEEAQLLFYSYLEPLRNAELELRPYAKGNKVTSLFKEMTKYEKINEAGENEEVELNIDKKNQLANTLQDVIQDRDWTGVVKTGESFVNEHLEKADIRKKESRVHLKLLEYKYDNIVKGVLTRKPVYEEELLNGDFTQQKYFDISQNGLGENNLILASSVLGDLKNRRAEQIEHYYALLIEEPEAHLHPQKQNSFFNYLSSLKDLGVQIFVTSHSPTITAKSDLDNLLVLQKQDDLISNFALKKSELSSNNKNYLRKFLDVTKSQLFFSNGTIMVEGISEALLLPVFAEIMGEEFNLDKNGIELININGVAFEPFAKLYNSEDASKRLSAFCSIITDNDKGLIAPKHFLNEEQNIDKSKAKLIFEKLKELNIIDTNNRIINFDNNVDLVIQGYEVESDYIKEVLNIMFDKISDRAFKVNELTGANLKVVLAENTFEYELMVVGSDNSKIMLGVYKRMHPKTIFIDSEESLHNKAIDLLEKLKSNKDKSEFAQNLSLILESKEIFRDRFIIPDYIQNSIRWVINRE